MNLNISSRGVWLLFLLISTVSSAFSQISSINTAPFIGVKVKSIIDAETSKTNPADTATKNISNIPGKSFKNNEKFTWEVTFEDKNNGNTIVTKKLKRVVWVLNAMGALLKYDSNDATQSGFGLQMAMVYDPMIGETTNRTVKDNTKPLDAPSSKLDKFGSRNVPIYDSTFFWNCLFFTPVAPKIEKDLSWQTELILTDRTLKTDYTIQSCNADSIVVILKSHGLAKDTSKIAAKNTEVAMPIGGSAGSKLKESFYDGILIMDAKTLFVRRAKIQVIQIVNSSTNGVVTELKNYTSTKVYNTIEN